MTKVAQFRLVTGEWIVGEVRENLEPKNYVVLKEPLILHVAPSGPDSYRIVLVPFNPADPKGEQRITLSAIMSTPEEVSKALHDAYVRQTSGIEVIQSLEGLK